MSYPLERAEVFETVKGKIEAKYPGVDVKGKQTERNGSEMMITLAFVPKGQLVGRPAEDGAEDKPYQTSATAVVHDFVSELIEEHSVMPD